MQTITINCHDEFLAVGFVGTRMCAQYLANFQFSIGPGFSAARGTSSSVAEITHSS